MTGNVHQNLAGMSGDVKISQPAGLVGNVPGRTGFPQCRFKGYSSEARGFGAGASCRT
ncbi:MAG: hypothetical protein Q4E67_01725 [Planctomycetia bacterium]|nr:hypothetical protein [Planctomycetia bacterium]